MQSFKPGDLVKIITPFSKFHKENGIVIGLYNHISYSEVSYQIFLFDSKTEPWFGITELKKLS